MVVAGAGRIRIASLSWKGNKGGEGEKKFLCEMESNNEGEKAWGWMCQGKLMRLMVRSIPNITILTW